MTETRTVQLPPLALHDLRALYQQMKQAEATYNLALNAMLAALGLDPRLANSLNIDTGTITPAQEGE